MSNPTATSSALGRAEPTAGRGVMLTIILLCQLMVGVDSTIVTVALPRVQGALHFSSTGLAWVQNSYMLAVGGLLLLGGRAGDILGRRRVFITGVVVFTTASLLGGLATTAWWLLAARIGQGVGAAIASPSVMALIATNFPEGAVRNRALAIYSTVSGIGGSLGLILGGVLTDWVSWRGVFFVNVPVGILIAVLAPGRLHEPERHRGRFDLGGALTVSIGVAALVYAFIRAAETGWSDTATIVSFAVSAVLLAAFVLIERNAEQPIVPLGLFASTMRSSAYVNQLLLYAALFGVFFFLTQFLQNGMGFNPLLAGVAFLPLQLGLFATVRIVPKLIARFTAKPVMLAGATLIAIAFVWLTMISSESAYLTAVLGPLVLFGVGAGCSFMPLNMTILSGVAAKESGAASGVAQTMMWLGGSVGTAILVTVFGFSMRHEAGRPLTGLTATQRAHDILAHGVSGAFVGGAVFTVCALLIVIALIRPARPAA